MPEHPDLRATGAQGRHAARNQIDLADEAGDEFRCGTVVEILGAAQLHDRALIHHGDAVGHRHRLFLVVGHVYGRDRQALLQVANFLAHLHAQARVEVGQRLVEQQHARPDDDRARERDALLLAARELAGKLLLVARQPDQLQDFADRARDLRIGLAAHAQAVGDVLEHRKVRKKRVVLEHEADVALVRRQVGHVLPPMEIRPESGNPKPAIIRSVVVLPQPEGPSRVRNSPGRTSSLTSRAA